MAEKVNITNGVRLTPNSPTKDLDPYVEGLGNSSTGQGNRWEPGLVSAEDGNDGKHDGDNPAGLPATLDFANGRDLRHMG